MTAVEIVKTFITALQSGDMEMAATIMADDFVARGLADHELDKRAFLAMQSELQDAMPDLSYNLSEAHTHEHLVRRNACIVAQSLSSHLSVLSQCDRDNQALQGRHITFTLYQRLHLWQ